MRATCLVLFAFSLCGCGKIDSSRSNAAIDASPPTVTVKTKRQFPRPSQPCLLTVHTTATPLNRHGSGRVGRGGPAQ